MIDTTNILLSEIMTIKTKSTIFHNKIAKKYESYYTEPYYQLYLEVTWCNLKKYLPKSKRGHILDAGGGTGFWSRKLAKLGYNVVCSDISQGMLKVGAKFAEKEKLGDKIRFRYADMMNMNCFKHNAFDMVIAQGDPVGYCGNPNKAIKELSRVAKKGAYVCVSIDSFYSMLSKLITNKKFKQAENLLKTHVTEFHGNEYPQYNFTVDELKRLFQNNGLKVIEIIGKPVFAGFVPRNKLNKILQDKTYFKKFLDFENKFNNEPSIVGLSNHIQIVGRKIYSERTKFP